MRLRITFKDPDGVYECVREAVAASVTISDLSDRERSLVVEERTEAVKERLSRWIEYGEYLVVEFDTEAGTATVVPKE